MTFNNFSQLTGKTPLLKLSGFNRRYALKAKIFAKLEFLNPAGSVKDRAVVSMLNAAENSGRLKEGGTLVEATSGNTGIALAAACAARGYKVVLAMPENMSLERRALLKAYGAELFLTEAAKGMAEAVRKAEEIAVERGGVVLGQFENPANTAAHFNTTGPEIWKDMCGKADILVAGVGTGGTVSGAGAFLKGKNPEIKVIAVEPADSPVLSKGVAGTHKIQGIGAGFVPEILNRKIIDGVIAVGEEQALSAVKQLVKTQGLFVGISSGAALYAAVCLASLEENSGKNIVVILPDGGERYLSTELFS